MKKKISIVVAILLALLMIFGYVWMRKFNNMFFKEIPNHLTYSTDLDTIPFEWAVEEFEDHYEPHVAMHIPARIKGLPTKVKFQFDTGASHSYIYENTLKSLKKYISGYEEITIDNERYLARIELVINARTIQLSNVKIYPNYGPTIADGGAQAVIQIGTIGSDFLDNKITVIDFKNQILQIHNEKPTWMKSLSGFESFDFTGRRFMLPVKIDGKSYELYYDSGSSAFGLITTQHRFNKYAIKGADEINYDANRRDEGIPIHHKPTNTNVTLGGQTLNLKRVSYVDMYGGLQRFMTPFTRIGGWLGNKPFTESTLILDTKDEEFIILDSK